MMHVTTLKGPMRVDATLLDSSSLLTTGRARVSVMYQSIFLLIMNLVVTKDFEALHVISCVQTCFEIYMLALIGQCISSANTQTGRKIAAKNGET